MFRALTRSNLRPTNLAALAKSFSSESTIATTPIPDAESSKYSASRSRNLFSRISPVRHGNDVVKVLDQWVAEGREVHNIELGRIIRDLRKRKRYSQALQISEWIRNSIFTFSPGDCAVHLDLIGAVRGSESAEKYFGTLSDESKNEKTYGSLMNSYVREGLLTKALLHMEKMKKKGYASSCLPYNNLMALYKTTDQPEKIPEILLEMKNNGVCPNNFSYRICINSYGERSDLMNMEKLLEEIESQPDISLDWATYSIVAYRFIKANDKEKALTYMKKLEEKIDSDAMGYNHLISLYSHLGNKDEILRLWVLQKMRCKMQSNREYITMIGSLVKIGAFENAEALLKQWENSCRNYDFRVPNILLIGYCKTGQVVKAETMLRDILNRGKNPTPNSWSIISTGYLKNGDMEKGFECMKEAFVVIENNVKWVPKDDQITKILDWLGEKGEIEELEGFKQSLTKVVPVKEV